MSTMKYASLDLGTVEAVFNKLGGVEGARRFLRGEVELSELKRPWMVDAEGIIRFTVVSNGMTGEQWIAHFESKGMELTKWAKDVLRSDKFVPTNGVTYRVVVIPGRFWETDNDRRTKNIRQEANRRNWPTPPAELACLIRDKFSNKEIEQMGLYWIVTMHEPIKDPGGDPNLLGTRRACYGLCAYCGGPDDHWLSIRGFAFLEQVSN